jgi:hypothetical protein
VGSDKPGGVKRMTGPPCAPHDGAPRLRQPMVSEIVTNAASASCFPLWLSERTIVGILHDVEVWLAAVREGQYREGSPLSKPLVKASIETFDQFVDDLEPSPSLNL